MSKKIDCHGRVAHSSKYEEHEGFENYTYSYINISTNMYRTRNEKIGHMVQVKNWNEQNEYDMYQERCWRAGIPWIFCF